MLTHIKKLGGETLLYALMNVGTKLIAFFMLPIFTKYLSPAEMGAMENIEALVSILTFVIIFGTDSALAYYYFRDDNQEDKEQFVKSVLNFRVSMGLMITILFLVFGENISLFLLGSSYYAKIFIFVGLSLLFDAIVTVVLTYYRYEFKAKKVAFITIVQMLMVAIVTFICLKYINLMVESIYLARIISAVLIILVLILPIFQFLQFKIEKKILLLLLKYGAPLVPASIAFWVISFSNRFFLTHFESLDSAGVYGVAMKFAAMISLLTSSVQMAWRPYSMSIQKQENAPEVYAKISMGILAIGMLGLTGVATVAPLIVNLMIPQEEFKEAGKYIAFLSLGSFLSFYYLIISVGLFIKESTKVISKYVIISALLSIILNVLLIPTMSIWGAASALVLSYLFVNYIIYKKSQEVYFIPLPLIKALLILLTGVISLLGITFIYELKMSLLYLILPWISLFAVIIITLKPKALLSIKRMDEGS